MSDAEYDTHDRNCMYEPKAMTDTKHEPDCPRSQRSVSFLGAPCIVQPCTCGASTAKPTPPLPNVILAALEVLSDHIQAQAKHRTVG